LTSSTCVWCASQVFGVGTVPDLPDLGWMPWLQEQADAGLKVAVVSQCGSGPLRPELYASGSGSLGSTLTASFGPRGGMTPECAVVKTMLTLAYPDLAMGEAIAGEL
jgi:L-asparaginase